MSVYRDLSENKNQTKREVNKHFSAIDLVQNNRGSLLLHVDMKSSGIHSPKLKLRHATVVHVAVSFLQFIVESCLLQALR